MGREERLEKGGKVMSYVDTLRKSAAEAGNIVCMGLDPVMDVLPESDAGIRERLNGYFSEIFRRMRLEGLSPAAFKPNIGYYASLDNPREENFDGSLALVDILDMLDTYFPGIPVILDSKRGDIARRVLDAEDVGHIVRKLDDHVVGQGVPAATGIVVDEDERV